MLTCLAAVIFLLVALLMMRLAPPQADGHAAAWLERTNMVEIYCLVLTSVAALGVCLVIAGVRSLIG